MSEFEHAAAPYFPPSLALSVNIACDRWLAERGLPTGRSYTYAAKTLAAQETRKSGGNIDAATDTKAADGTTADLVSADTPCPSVGDGQQPLEERSGSAN